MHLLDLATKREVILRLMGALAFKVHRPTFASLYGTLGREISDIDFAGYSSQSNGISAVFAESEYILDREALHEIALAGRMIFQPKERPTPHIDVFLDRLQMCHDIDFRGRLENDYPTLSLADLLLEKMQIVRINEKDIQDTIILLREHELSKDNEKEKIDVERIANLLTDDWGFYYTATSNLSKVKEALNKYEALKVEDKEIVTERLHGLLGAIDEAPKSVKWRMRAKIGTKRKWYRDIEEVKR